MAERLIQAEEEGGGDKVKKATFTDQPVPQKMECFCGKMCSRKEKRKAMKKMKRKQIRAETAIKERQEEEARLNDPEEQTKIRLMAQEEAERMERERTEFEERERAWIEAMEIMKKKKEAEEEEEAEGRKALEESSNHQNENEDRLNQDGDWEYVDDGPPEIIWQGNEIIFRKKKVRIPKKDSDHQNKQQDADRPTSNPLPPQSESFADFRKTSLFSTQHVLENVAEQVPNFGTEQDKAHCPFHLKTGACRFGQRCSRVHFYPDKSCTLLLRNMYNGPGLAWEQDEGLEYTDEEVERCYEEFYEDVHTEFQKFGEILNFKVCKNGSFHLRGNVYVQYRSMESALSAFASINGRYFAGKQVRCEFVNVNKWKVAICGEYMKSGFKTCSHGTACNFIHCFRNPGGDYEWADLDKPPPIYWVKKMAALFGHSDEYEKLIERENLDISKNSGKILKSKHDRHRYRRSNSDEMDSLNDGGSSRERHTSHCRKETGTPNREVCRENNDIRDNRQRSSRAYDTDSGEEWLDKSKYRKRHSYISRKSSTEHDNDDRSRVYDVDSDINRSDRDGHDEESEPVQAGKKSKQWDSDDDTCIAEKESVGHWSGRGTDHIPQRKSSRHQISRGNRESEHDCFRKRSRLGRGSSKDDVRDYERENYKFDGDSSPRDRDKRIEICDGKHDRGSRETQHNCSRKRSRQRHGSFRHDYGDREDKYFEVNGDSFPLERDSRSVTSDAKSHGANGETGHDCLRKKSRHRRPDDEDRNYVNEDLSPREKNRKAHHRHRIKSSKQHGKSEYAGHGSSKNVNQENGEFSDTKTDGEPYF